MKTEIIKFEKNSMSSLEIAEITGKQHAHIMRDIRNILEQGVNESNFGLVEYTDKKGEKRPHYNLTRKGCLILASGYDAVLREKIIDRWEQLETRINELVLKENQELKEENRRLQNQAPFPICKESATMQTFANFLTTYTGEKIGRTTLFAMLRKMKYIQVETTRPYQKYINNGFFEVATKSEKIVPLITPKGQAVIAKRIMKSLPTKISSFSLF